MSESINVTAQEDTWWVLVWVAAAGSALVAALRFIFGLREESNKKVITLLEQEVGSLKIAVKACEEDRTELKTKCGKLEVTIDHFKLEVEELKQDIKFLKNNKI